MDYMWLYVYGTVWIFVSMLIPFAMFFYESDEDKTMVRASNYHDSKFAINIGQEIHVGILHEFRSFCHFGNHYLHFLQLLEIR